MGGTCSSRFVGVAEIQSYQSILSIYIREENCFAICYKLSVLLAAPQDGMYCRRGSDKIRRKSAFIVTSWNLRFIQRRVFFFFFFFFFLSMISIMKLGKKVFVRNIGLLMLIYYSVIFLAIPLS